MNSSFNKNSDLYFQYHRAGRSYHEKIRFYEEYIQADETLSYDEKIELCIDYHIALFEAGRYYRFLSKIDSVIELVVEENILNYNGKDIFFDLLFKKAASFYNVYQYEEAIHLLKQLNKINPEEKIVNQLLVRCYGRMRKESEDVIKLLSILLISVAILFTLINIFVVSPFYPQYTQNLTNVNISILMIGICIFVINESAHLIKYIRG